MGCLNLFIWDTAGQEIYRSMIKMYYRGIAVAIVVYDVTDKQSFERIGDWLKDIREKQQNKLGSKGGSGDQVMYYIIANKTDLNEEEREVTKEEGQEWVQEFKDEEEEPIDITFMEVSAKSGNNIQPLFSEIT